MAITKIRPIKIHGGSLTGAKRILSSQIEYVCNGEKTEEKLLVSCFGCTYETASREFMMTAGTITQRKGANVAYHLKQSFKPGEVSPEEAHQIGKEFADAILGGKYQYVLTTHTDKSHIHNHLIFCATSFKDKQKYNDCTKIRYERERVNDKICRKHGLSVIEKKSGIRGYRIWENETEAKESNREKIRKYVEIATEKAESYEAFVMIMGKLGCEVRDNGNGISYRMNGSERFIRSSSIKVYDETGNRITDYNCTKEGILKKINENIRRKNRKFILTPDKKFLIFEVRERINFEKKSEKGDIDALNKMVKTLNYLEENNIETDSVFEKNLNDFSKKYEKSKKNLSDFSEKMNRLSMTINYGKNYWKHKKIYEQSLKMSPENNFLAEHQKEILNFKKAEQYLNANGISEKELSIKGMIAEYQEMKKEQECLKQIFEKDKAEYKKILAVKMNCEMMLDRKVSAIYDRYIEIQEQDRKTEGQYKEETDKNERL